LNKIPKEQNPNALVILRCYKNAISSNVKFSIIASQIETLREAMEKTTKMEDIMLETCIDLDIILWKSPNTNGQFGHFK
jgi:hypothetical protein